MRTNAVDNVDKGLHTAAWRDKQELRRANSNTSQRETKSKLKAKAPQKNLEINTACTNRILFRLQPVFDVLLVGTLSEYCTTA